VIQEGEKIVVLKHHRRGHGARNDFAKRAFQHACYYEVEQIVGGTLIMGPLGTQEMVVIFLLALLLFGPKKLPEIGRTIGKYLTEFRRASNELKATFDREMQNLEAETGVKEIVNQYQYESYNYDYSSHESTYEPAYESESYDSTASTPTTPSASATEGAESTVAVAPEGTVARNPEIAERTEAMEPASEDLRAAEGHSESIPASPTAEHKT